MEKEIYKRLNLKNGWDLPKGEKPPLTGRKQQLIRAYELLILKSDEEYIQEAEAAKRRNVTTGKPHIQQGLKPEAAEQPTDVATVTPATEQTESGWENLRDELPISKDEKDILAAARAADDTDWKKVRQKKRLISLAACAAVVVIAVCRLLFGPAILTADIASYKDVPIEIVGLTDKPFVITPGELAKMKKTRLQVEVHEEEVAEGEKPELGIAVGPTLDTFLKKYDMTTDDIRSMKVYDEKDESTAYVRTLEEDEIILSVANGKEALGEKEAPLRIAASGQEAAEWSGWIRRIEFVLKE